MKFFRSEKYLITESYTHNTDKFEILDKIPWGYIIWNIGRWNFKFDGYIPLAKLADEPFHIKRNSLKAVYVGKEFSDWLLEKSSYRIIYSQEINDLREEFELSAQTK